MGLRFPEGTTDEDKERLRGSRAQQYEIWNTAGDSDVIGPTETLFFWGKASWLPEQGWYQAEHTFEGTYGGEGTTYLEVLFGSFTTLDQEDPSAAEWYDLSNLTLGSPAYNAALEDITEQFVTAGANPANLPNKSALNQIRTNEVALDSPWELREFRIQGPGHYDSGHLRSVTVAMTPDLSFNLTSTLADFINQNETAILSGNYEVPLVLPSGSPFLGGNAPTPFGMIWDGSPGCSSINNPDARHNFSLTTCSGCHAGETATPFLHICLLYTSDAADE